MINSTPLAVNPIGTEASGKPIYKGRDGKPIYGLPNARAARSYFGAVGGTTQMPNMNDPSFPGYSMGRGWKDQRRMPKDSYRRPDGERVVQDAKGNEIPVGRRINARAGNKAVEARDAENKAFFDRARAVNQAQQGGGQQPAAPAPTPAGPPQAAAPAAPPQQARPPKDFVTHPYSSKPHSVNDPEFQRPGNAVYDAKQKTRKLTPPEQTTADSWAKFDATPYGKTIKAAQQKPKA